MKKKIYITPDIQPLQLFDSLCLGLDVNSNHEAPFVGAKPSKSSKRDAEKDCDLYDDFDDISTDDYTLPNIWEKK